MQPSKSQVRQSLAALQSEPVLPRSPEDACTHPDGPCDRSPRTTLGDLPEGLLAQLEDTVAVRSDRLDHARVWLAHVDEISADDLADRIVGRLVCDRLR
jgi:hypothetical protein